ncbi:MAG: hypothetical protein R3C19_00505 [Planctomycetaceae bacterium]
MSQSAHVRSLDSVRQFTAAVAMFQEEARLCVSSLEMQLQRILGWLERDRPAFWKREIEVCYRNISEARVRLHQCQMRRHGDFKPTCYEEKKDLERVKKEMEFAQKQIPVVKHWNMAALHEANEYRGRSSQMTQLIERDLPRLLGLLHHAIDRLEAYGDVAAPVVERRSASDPVPQPESPDPPEKTDEADP